MRALALSALLLAGCGGGLVPPGYVSLDASTHDAATSDARADASTADASGADAPTADVSVVSAAAVLAAGAVVELPVVAGVASVRLATPVGNERYVLVLASTRFDPGKTAVDYHAAALSSGAFPAPAPVDGCSLDHAAWRAMTPPVEPVPTGAAPMVGARYTFLMPRTEPNPPMGVATHVVAVSDHAVVWADDTITLDDAFVADLLHTFESTILPREHAVFGVESDVNGDGRISLVFSPVTAESNAEAFFWQCDLLMMDGCGTSNATEAIYLTPLDTISPPYNTAAAMDEILSHELGHLIHFSRKVVRNSLHEWDDSGFMVEGFGHLAQDVIGFQADNLLATQLALGQFNYFSIGDVFNDLTPYDLGRDAPMRGGTYLFVRWLYDRAGGDDVIADGTLRGGGGPALVHALLDSPTSVATSLHPLTGADLEDLAVDFFTAVATSNRDEEGGVAPANECFRYQAVVDDPLTHHPRGADPFAHIDTTTGPVMGTGPAMVPLASADGHLLLGGAEYLLLAPTGGQREVGATVTVDPSAQVRVRVARIR